MKIKVMDLDLKYLNKVKKRSIAKAKAFYDTQPFVTKVYLAMKLKMPYRFISDNWVEITGDNFE